jgi:undecaprenyl diphosphate synthase
MADKTTTSTPATELSRENLPAHVAIIMDGNGRYAKGKLQPRVWGHRKGVERVREVVQACGDLGIKVLTLFAFSEENWGRPRDEVDTILGLIDTYLEKEKETLHRNGVRFRVLGDSRRLPPRTAAALGEFEALTARNEGLVLNVALSYGSRSEIARAARILAEKAVRGEIRPEEIDQAAMSRELFTAGTPDPDLLIRTSGELRISNFLLWQLAYTELYFTPVLWPDFGRAQLLEALQSYQTRQRRFGRLAKADESAERGLAASGAAPASTPTGGPVC